MKSISSFSSIDLRIQRGEGMWVAPPLQFVKVKKQGKKRRKGKKGEAAI